MNSKKDVINLSIGWVVMVDTTLSQYKNIRKIIISTDVETNPEQVCDFTYHLNYPLLKMEEKDNIHNFREGQLLVTEYTSVNTYLKSLGFRFDKPISLLAKKLIPYYLMGSTGVQDGFSWYVRSLDQDKLEQEKDKLYKYNLFDLTPKLTAEEKIYFKR